MSTLVNPAFTMSRYAKRMSADLPMRVLLRIAAFLLLLCGLSAPALANVTFTMTTGRSATNTQALTIDSNKCPTQGPTSAYVGGMLTNTSASQVTNVTATISGLNANIYLAGNQPASQYIGTMSAGQSIAVFWFVGYSCSVGATATPTITATSDSSTTNTGINLFIRSAISANAGGQVIGSTLGPGAVVGQTIYFDAQYDFGGTAAGDEYFLQPAGAQNFDAECFRLVGSEIIASNVNAAPVGSTDQLYYIQPNKQAGNNYFITVRYFLEYLCANASTSARPYAVQTSGTQIKYTGNFDGPGAVDISFPPASFPFTITKSVVDTVGEVGETDTVTYTVTISNPSNIDSIMSEIRDVLPPGMEFVAIDPSSDVQLANSSAVPSAGATGTLNFVGRRGQSYYLAANGSVTLVYTARKPASAGSYTNSAQGVFGAATTTIAQAGFTMFDPAVSPPGLTCLAGSSVFSWDSVSWPAGSTSNAYALGVLGDITFDVAEQGSFASNATYGGAAPRLSSAISGGLGANGSSLVLNVDRSTNAQTGTVTITLPVVLPGAEFSLYDIDANTGHQDVVEVYGELGGVRVDPTVTPGRVNSAAGSVVTGNNTSSDVQSLGNAGFTFDSSIDTIVIVYSNGAGAAADPSEQVIALHDITYCNPVPILSVTKTSFIISDPVNGTNNPKAIPGATVEYLISVSNAGAGVTDPDSVIVWDDGPAEAKMCLLGRNGGPAIFADPDSDSGLTYGFAALGDAGDDLEFSNDDGASFNYVPVADADGCDTAITDFRLRPGGSLAGFGDFTVTVRFIIE